MTTVPTNLVHNAFLDNLGTDWVAIAGNGHPIARGQSETEVRHAVRHTPGAVVLSGADLSPAKAPSKPVTAKPSAIGAETDPAIVLTSKPEDQKATEQPKVDHADPHNRNARGLQQPANRMNHRK